MFVKYSSKCGIGPNLDLNGRTVCLFSTLVTKLMIITGDVKKMI
jgi:hypothetical protein